MLSYRVRELYQYSRVTKQRLTNTNRIEEGAWTVPSSIPNRYNSCCSGRAAATSDGQSRQLAPWAIYQHMTQTYVKTPSYVRVVQNGAKNWTRLKTQDSNLVNIPVSDCPMRLRYCGLEDKKKTRGGVVVNKERTRQPHWTIGHGSATPAVVLRKIHVQSNGGLWTTWTFTSEVIV